MWHVGFGHNVWAGFGVLHLVVSELSCNNSAVDRVQKCFWKLRPKKGIFENGFFEMFCGEYMLKRYKFFCFKSRVQNKGSFQIKVFKFLFLVIKNMVFSSSGLKKKVAH